MAKFLSKNGLKYYNSKLKEKHDKEVTELKETADKIHTALETVHKADIDKLADRITDLDNQLSQTHISDINQLKKDLNNLETSQNQAHNDIESKITDNKNNIDSLTALHSNDVNTINNKIEELETKIGQGGSTDLTSVNKSIKANADNISTLDTSLKSHINDTSVHFTKSEMQTELTKDVLPGQLLTLMNNKISGVDLVTTLNALDNREELEEQLKQKPVTLEDVFNNWTRFSHYLGNQSASNSQNSTVRSGWGYNASKNAISMSQNLDPYGGFISDKKYTNYNVSIHGYCYSSGDDDIISIVVGFLSSSESADGKEHTLSVIRTGAGSNGFVTDNSTRADYNFALVYDLGNYERSVWDAKVLAHGTGTTLRGSDWTSTGAMISVIRQGTKIQAQTTQMGNLKDYVNSINYELGDKPSNFTDAEWTNVKAMLENPSNFGFAVSSQSSYFELVSTKGIFDNTDIYYLPNDEIYKYSTSQKKWISSEKISDVIDGMFVFNKQYKKLYYYKNKEILFILNTL